MQILQGAVFGVFVLSSINLWAQDPAVVKRDGHVSPVHATITTPSGAKREVTVIGFGMAISSYMTHVVKGFDADTGGQVTIWIDEIASIRNTTPEDFTVVLKSGQTRHLKYGASGDCTRPAVPQETGQFAISTRSTDCAFIHTAQDQEIIDIAKLKLVSFAVSARTDSMGNVMQDDWKFSPFTGEKLK